MEGKPVLAVDGTGLLVRCSRAGRSRGLAAPDGTPTGTLTLFVSSLARHMRRAQPSHVVIAWDGPHATRWRRGMYLPYKAGRMDLWGMGGELEQAMEFCEAAGIYQLWRPGFEADDVLAWVTRAAMHMPGKPVLLCSDDNDLLQLLDDCPDTPVFQGGLSDQYTGTARWVDTVTTAAWVEREWGLSPLWLPKLRALAGDPSDNIPGLPGVGRRRALQMLHRGGLVWPPPEDVINDPDHRRLAVIWRDIIDLVIPLRAVDSELEPGTCHRFADLSRWEPGGGQNVLHLLEQYGMTRIAQRLQKGGLW